jgi:hypothetical protein
MVSERHLAGLSNRKWDIVLMSLQSAGIIDQEEVSLLNLMRESGKIAKQDGRSVTPRHRLSDTV